jgi:hypothetical protein
MQLRAAYIGGLPLEHAAEKVGVPPGTARNWYRAARDSGDDWDKLPRGQPDRRRRRHRASARPHHRRRPDALRSAARERPPTPKTPSRACKAMATLGDTIAKLRAAAKSFMPDISEAAVAADTLKALATWIGDTAPARGILLADLVEPFAGARKLPIAASLEELRARARASGAIDTTRAGGLSDDSAEQIRSKILGVK